MLEKLLQYGVEKGLMGKWDLPQVRNQLLALLNLDAPIEEKKDSDNKESITKILEKILDYSVSKGLINNTITEKDLFDSKLMAQLMPRQSELIHQFEKITKQKGIKAATDYFYKLSQDSNYIRMDRVCKNKHWDIETEFGKIEITINLSKPEKNSAEIAAERKVKSSNYPKCLLCIENVGYDGRLNHPGRSNHRAIPVTLGQEQWYYQYSPYVYYHEHAIIFSENHRPMNIGKNTLIRLLDFVELFPHYFIGSNAELPIVGGSILSHDHFQGGGYELPMARAKTIQTFKNLNYPNIKIKMLKWPLSVIRLVSKNKAEVVELGDKILSSWRNYTDQEANIIASTEGTPHNTVTPIARINKEGEFELDLALRNNRTTIEHPDGLFHPYKRLHHIKRENIGLIEVMGLAILPARLEKELAGIIEILTGHIPVEVAYKNDSLIKHQAWIEYLLVKYGTTLTKIEAEQILKEEVGMKFKECLECSGVFKQNDKGQEVFERFLNLCTRI